MVEESIQKNGEIKNKISAFQKSEITEHFVYNKLSRLTKNPKNKEILAHISGEELKHYGILKKYTKEDVTPDKIKIWFYFLISKIFGITFGTKLMEKGEIRAQLNYRELFQFIPEAKNIAQEEDEHERKLINLIDEERLKYVGSMVLGVNDALVELTGALAGLTLAFQNTRLIGMTGLITGFAASLSMAVSEYLSTKTEEVQRSPLKASLYTGFAYILAVIFLIFPYFVFKNIYFCLGFTIFNAITLIFIFTFYISVAKDFSFKKRFFEMALLTLGVSSITFFIGFLIRTFSNVEI